MKSIILIASLIAILESFKVLVMTTINFRLSHGFHSTIMKKVMNAPINTFFDITPVGKILVRFSKDLDVFKGPLFWACFNFFNKICHITSTIAVLAYVSSWNFIPISIIALLFSRFAIPYLAIDN